jgi:calcium/calmodulin-dependent 3',5'-cyclic nucleotide phosphodiesterase
VYNDKSTLEHFHVSSAFRELNKPEQNILAGLPLQQYEQVRKLVIDMVLSTDLGQHFEVRMQARVILSSRMSSS